MSGTPIKEGSGQACPTLRGDLQFNFGSRHPSPRGPDSGRPAPAPAVPWASCTLGAHTLPTGHQRQAAASAAGRPEGTLARRDKRQGRTASGTGYQEGATHALRIPAARGAPCPSGSGESREGLGAAATPSGGLLSPVALNYLGHVRWLKTVVE